MLTNLVIAHRGVHDNITIPENSLLAFQEAIKKKYPIELDIQITKDNNLVIFHDDNLKRMTGLDKDIQETSYSEIKKLYLKNTKEKIPTFQEVLQLVNGKVILDIEIKNTKKKKEIIELILKALENYKGKVLLKSFNPNIIKKIKKQTTKYPLGILVTDNYHKFLANFAYKTKLIFKYIKYIKPDFIAINKKMLTNNFYKKMKDQYFIFIWTITKKEQLEKYQKKFLNISYICNNLYK